MFFCVESAEQRAVKAILRRTSSHECCSELSFRRQVINAVVETSEKKRGYDAIGIASVDDPLFVSGPPTIQTEHGLLPFSLMCGADVFLGRPQIVSFLSRGILHS